MAPTPLPAMPVTISYQDASGSPGSDRLFVPAATTIAALDTALDTLSPLILGVSDCAILGYSLSRSYVDLVAPAAIAGSRIERRAVFGFRTAAGKMSRVSVPGVKAALVSPAGGLLTTNAAVLALVNELLNGLWCDSNGSSLDRLMYDEERYTETSKRQKTTDISPTS